MKKLFTLFAAVLFAGSMMAKDVTYSFPGTAAQVLTFADGATLTIDNDTKALSAGNGTIDGVTTIKNSNGVDLIFVAPQGKEIEAVTFKAVTNDDATKAVLKFVNSEAVNDTVNSLKDYNNPRVYTYTFDEAVSQFTFVYGVKQVCFVMTVHYAGSDVDVTFDSEGLRAYRFQKNDSTWYLSWQGKEQSSKTHKVELYRTTNLANKFGHFTTADFDLTESYFSDVEGGEFVTTIDVTLTETEYGFTMSGYVVAADGVTYNLAGEYAAPKATPSVTSFTTLSELDGLTITLSGVEVQLAGLDGAIYLTDESLDVLYGEGHNYTFSNNVLTIESFEYVAGEMDPLPEEGKDMLIFTESVISGYYNLPLCTIHFDPNPSALEDNAAGVKATKALVNGKVVIRRGDKHYNLFGAEL